MLVYVATLLLLNLVAEPGPPTAKQLPADRAVRRQHAPPPPPDPGLRMNLGLVIALVLVVALLVFQFPHLRGFSLTVGPGAGWRRYAKGSRRAARSGRRCCSRAAGGPGGCRGGGGDPLGQLTPYVPVGSAWRHHRGAVGAAAPVASCSRRC